MRMGLFTALAIGIHNFPEGLATFLAALEDPELGIAIAVAIALHNIPEGISVSVPIFYATGNRKKAFVYSSAQRLWPSRWAPASPTSCSCLLLGGTGADVPQESWASSSAAWPASWSTSAWTSCCPPAGPTARGTTASSAWSPAWLVMALSLLLMK